MASAPDVEAGKAYVTFYLRRVNYDRDIEQLERDNEKLDRQMETPQSRQSQPRPSESAAALARSATDEAGQAAQAVASIGQQGTPEINRLVESLNEVSTAAIEAAQRVSEVPAVPAAIQSTTTKAPQSQTETDNRQPSQTTEVGISIPAELAESVAKGAAMRAGGVALAKTIPFFREAGVAAATAAPAVASVGTATAAAGTAATAAAPAIAGAGAAATGASVGFGAMASAALPILAPLAAIAAAAGLVYVAIFKWDELSFPVKALLLVLSPLVLICRAVVLAVKAVGLAVSVVTAPFRLAAAAVGLFHRTILAIPGAIAAIPGLLRKVGGAAVSMGAEVAKGAARMASSVVSATGRTVAALGRMASQIATTAADAINATAVATRSIGISIAKAGAITAGLSAAIVGPLTLAAKEFAAHGEKIRKLQNDYQRFELSAEEASLLSRVHEQTGESLDKLAEQLRDGTRDFSRWKAEIRASGTEMSGTGLSAALALSRAYYSLKESVTGLRLAIGAALSPAIQDSTEVITGAIRGVTKWISENRPLVAQIFKVATAVGAAGAALTSLGGIIAGAGTLLSPFTLGLAAVAGGMALVEYRTGAGRSLWAAYSDSVRRVYETVKKYLGQMLEFTTKTVGGIRDALAAGDLAGAVNIAWSAAKVAWIAGLMEIDDLTRGTFGGILANLAAGRWSAAGESVMNALKIAWIEGTGFLAGLWGQVVDSADSAWTALQTGLDAAVGGMKSTLQLMFEQLKQWGVDFLNWMSNSVLLPLAKSVAEYSSQAAGPIFTAAVKVKSTASELAETIKTPEKLAADQAAIEAETADKQKSKQDELAGRRGERDTAAEDARLEREKQIADLRRRQTELAQQAGPVAAARLAANQAALDKAIAAAAAARAAADAAKPKDEDFAISQKTESITRFSGEALALSVGRSSDEPQKRIAKLSEEQLREMRKISNDLGITLREVVFLQTQGGFG